MELCDHIRNHHEECIQMSTNIPSIGLVILEISLEIMIFKKNMHNDKPMAEF